ncbi:TIGR02270 family protein [Pyxidicoccus sp. 3LG]
MERTGPEASRPRQPTSLLGRPDRLPRWDVLELHLDEAAFLFTQWERALESATRDLQGVSAGVEQRLRAHLDALALAGPRVAERLLLPALAGDEPEYIRAAGVALLRTGEPARVEAVVQTLIEGEPTSRQEVQRALQLEWREDLPERLQPLLSTAEPPVQEAVLDVLGFHRIPPGVRLSEWMTRAGEPTLQAAALRAASFSGAEEVAAPVLRELLQSPEVKVREAALVLGLMRGQRMAWQACQQQAEARDGTGRLARLLLALGGEDKDVERLVELLQVPELRADVLWVLGFSGRLAAAEACLPWMRDEALAGLAAEAFCSIVGLKLEGALVGQREERDEEQVPLEEDLTRDLRPKEEDALPPPNPEAVESWWAKARKGFESTGRYLGGKRFGPESLSKALLEAPMRRRPPLALELAIRSQGRSVVEVRTWARVQWERLSATPGGQGRLPAQPFAAWMKA